jgi:5'-3' exonuclease
VSADRDLLQLVSSNIHQLLPAKNVIVDLDNFEDYAGCAPEHFLYYKAIMGDVSDNITGLSGYGIVRAKTLAEKINNNLNDYTELSPEQKEIIGTNLKIMDLKEGLVHRPSEEYHFIQQLNDTHAFDGEQFVKLTEYYGLGGFRRQLGSWSAIFNSSKNDIEDWFNNITM